MPSKKNIMSQLENRKHNLSVIQDAINADARSAEKLESVRNFLSQRIEVLEKELTA
ncbi:MAG: hypothetical protein JRN15_00190 [Nitrososphaerota archaeon]|nr:hypothetical protein [Nitrososphaerota archaeon]